MASWVERAKANALPSKSFDRFAPVINPLIRDEWLVGGNGSEVPFWKNGVRYLYVWNPARREHGFLNMSDDVVVNEFEFYVRDGYR